QLEACEAELRQPRRTAAERAQVLAPAGGSLPVDVCKPAEAQQVGGEAPLRVELLEVRVDLAGPVVGRPARDDPARLPVQLRAAQEAELLGSPGVVGAEPRGRHVVEVPALPLAGYMGEGSVRA